MSAPDLERVDDFVRRAQAILPFNSNAAVHLVAMAAVESRDPALLVDIMRGIDEGGFKRGHAAGILIALAISTLVGCAVSHEGPVVARNGARTHEAADAGMNTHPDGAGRPGAVYGPGTACTVEPPPGCVPVDAPPTIGEQPYCPAEHEWIPALADRWGITRHVAHDRCTAWVRCPGIGVPCVHCLDAGPEWAWWEGAWCDAGR